MRPLVVFSGQGLALADRFNLTCHLAKALAKRAPKGKLLALLRRESTLDDVFTKARGTGGEPMLQELVVLTRELCSRERDKPDHPQHREVFEALREQACHRAVVHLTTNVDGLTSRAAVGVAGALWAPLQRAGADVRWETIAADARSVLTAARGVLHLPLHGEANLAAVGGDAHHGARLLRVAPLAQLDANSTLAEGMGRGQVPRIEGRMIVSGLGYRLLGDLLAGNAVDVASLCDPRFDTVDVGPPIVPHGPADLLALGYGANANRADYPFERIVDAAHRKGVPSGATWRALVYQRNVCADEGQWYRAHGCDVWAFGDGELARWARAAMS